MTLTFTCLVCGYAPEWIPTAYTVQSTFYLTTRFWSYKRKAYHYFLFGGSPEHGIPVYLQFLTALVSKTCCMNRMVRRVSSGSDGTAVIAFAYLFPLQPMLLRQRYGPVLYLVLPEQRLLLCHVLVFDPR